MNMATNKQIRYALALMMKAGFPTEWMRREHLDLGALPEELGGEVRDWLKMMTGMRISGVITKCLRIIAHKTEGP